MFVRMHGRQYRSLVMAPWLGGSISEVNRPQFEAGRVDFGGQTASWRRLGPSNKRVSNNKQNTPVEKLTFANLSNTSKLICEVVKRWLRLRFEGGGVSSTFKDRPKRSPGSEKAARRQPKRPRNGAGRRLEEETAESRCLQHF